MCKGLSLRICIFLNFYMTRKRKKEKPETKLDEMG